MKNITLFSLSLFLLLPTATQCMEKEIVFKPKTMQDIRDERDKIYKKILKIERKRQFDRKYRESIMYNHEKMFLDRFVFQHNSIALLKPHLYFSHLKLFSFKECSCLSLAIIAIQCPKFESDHDRWGQMCNYDLIQNPKQAPFKEKKEIVQKCLTIFQPTEKDKYLALLTKNEEFGPTIIKKMLLLPDMLPVLEKEALQAFIKNISLLMFEMEESLF